MPQMNEKTPDLVGAQCDKFKLIDGGVNKGSIC